MTTRMTDIYEGFLSKISDYAFTLSNATPRDIEQDLFQFYQSASAKFYKCKHDLSTTPSRIDDSYKSETMVINSTLTPFEKEIIIKLMLVEYMLPQVLSSEVTRQALSDKDFQIYSQANQLRELNLLYRLFQKEAQKMMTEYSYMKLIDHGH